MTLRVSTKCFLIAAIAVAVAVSTNAQPAEQLKRASELFKQGNDNYSGARYDAAIANFTEYLKIRPNVATGWYNRGLAHWQKAMAAMSRADFEKAEADFTQAIKIDAKDADFWLHRAHARLRLIPVDFTKQVAQAIADYSEVIRLRPADSGAYTGRAQAYYEKNSSREAMADANKALQLNPNDYIALYIRGKLHTSAKNYAAARADLEKAIRLYPDYAYAMSALDYVNRLDLARNPAAVTRPAVTAARPPANSPAITAIAITSVSDGFKRADDAEKARDHRKVIDAVTSTLPFIKMRADGEPADELETHVYLDLIRKRARANMALKMFDAADADYQKAGMDALKNMNRHNARAGEEAARDKVSGGGAIMATLEAAKSTIICKSSFQSVSEWIDTIERDRSDQMAVKIKSVFLLSATRELCATSYTIHGMWQSVKTLGNESRRVEVLNKAIADYTDAIKYMQVFRKAYEERAKAYRELGRIDLALADEKKASELAVKK